MIHDGGTFSCEFRHRQEAMEFLEDQLLYDEEGIDLKEEADHGHEFDDEEEEAPQKNMGKSRVHTSSF